MVEGVGKVSKRSLAAFRCWSQGCSLLERSGGDDAISTQCSMLSLSHATRSLRKTAIGSIYTRSKGFSRQPIPPSRSLPTLLLERCCQPDLRFSTLSRCVCKKNACATVVANAHVSWSLCRYAAPRTTLAAATAYPTLWRRFAGPLKERVARIVAPPRLLA